MTADIEGPALHVNLQDSLDGKSMAYVRSCLGLTACLVLVSVYVMTQQAVGVRIGRRHARAVFYIKMKQQGTITSNGLAPTCLACQHIT